MELHRSSINLMAYPKRIEVLGVPIDPFTMEQTVKRAEELIREGVFAHLIGINADKLLQMRDDTDMDTIVRRCEIINADGISMVMGAERLGTSVPERVAGIDLMQELCAVAAKRSYCVYLLGATQKVVEQTKVVLESSYPGIKIVGIHNGYFAENDFHAIENLIRNAKPQLIFVGISSPKKEQLIEFFRAQGMTGVFVGVGGTFDVISGSIKRAPVWIQHIKLEWLYRMVQEPRRLTKRYVVGNVRFMHLLSQAQKEQHRRGK